MWGETLLLQQATVGLLKGVFGRARPFVYNDDPRIPAELKQSRTAVRSFPSGHTATAFAGAVFLGEVFARLNPADPARHWVRGGSLALAAATGWLRIAAGKHFLTDVIAGAFVGSLIGWGVPRLHEVDGGSDGGADKARPAPGLVFGFGF
jgi:membrane-associated phospholipid phosphatase